MAMTGKEPTSKSPIKFNRWIRTSTSELLPSQLLRKYMHKFWSKMTLRDYRDSMQLPITCTSSNKESTRRDLIGSAGKLMKMNTLRKTICETSVKLTESSNNALLRLLLSLKMTRLKSKEIIANVIRRISTDNDSNVTQWWPMVIWALLRNR